MIKYVYTRPRARKINHVIYDSACKARGLKKVQNDPWWCDVGLTVDTFHFKCKHKESDVDCQRYCNPADYPELMEGDTWFFNSSVAEQTNVWFGGYNAIVREMRSVKYNYFLDEVIIRRNAVLVQRLQQEGRVYSTGFDI